jgi:predicted NodU family carbamoyl transferase
MVQYVYLSDGEIVFFLEEERLSKNKHDEFPLSLLYYINKHFKINEIAISGLTGYYLGSIYKKAIIVSLKNLFLNIPINYNLINQHHLTHSTSTFYNSGFKKSLSIVIDGGGDWNDVNKKENFNGFETETIQIIEYPSKTQKFINHI